MSRFNDNTGQSWTIDVTVATIKRVKTLLDVDLMTIADRDLKGQPNLIARLISDPVLLVDVLYAVVQPEADRRGVTDADFGASMGGDAVDEATTALLEALVNFFPSQKRPVLERALAKIKEVEAQATQMALANLDSDETNREIERLLAEALGPSGKGSGSSPASSAATQPA